MPIASKNRMFAFDGTCPHEVKDYAGDVGARMSIIWFQNARGWRADASTGEKLQELGFKPAASAEDADAFAARFDRLSCGNNYHSWKLDVT